MSTEVILEEVKTYKVTCQYREGCTQEYHSKAYTFNALEPHIPGELVVVKDRYGYSLVKVLSCEACDIGLSGYSWVVNLDDVNEVARLAYKKEQVQATIREALIKDIEKNAFERLAASHPELKETLEDFKALGGSYSELMPSIKNLIGDIK